MSNVIRITVLLPADRSLDAENAIIREEIRNLFALKNLGDPKNVIYCKCIQYDGVEEEIRPYLYDANPVIVYGDELSRRIAAFVAKFLVACDTNMGRVKEKPFLFIAAGEIRDLARSPYLYRFCYSGDRYAKWLSLTKDVKENLIQRSVGFIVMKDDRFAMSMYDDIERYFNRQHIKVVLERCDLIDSNGDVCIDIKRLSDQYPALYVSGFGDNMKKLMSGLNGYTGAVYTDSAFAVTFDSQKKPNFRVYCLMPTGAVPENFRKYFAYFVSAAVLYLLENQNIGLNIVTEMSRLISTVYDKTDRRLGDVLIQDGGDLIFEQSLWCWDPEKEDCNTKAKGAFLELDKVGLCESVSWSMLKGHKLAAQLQGLDNIINGVDVRISAEGDISGVHGASIKIAHQIETGFESKCLALYLNNLKVHSADRLLYQSEDKGKEIKIGWLLAAISRLRLNDPIQLSLTCDSEDNNTYQIYIVTDNIVAPISVWEPHGSGGCSQLPWMIIAKTEEIAQAICRVERDRIDSPVCEDEFSWKPSLGGWVCLCKQNRCLDFLVKLKRFLLKSKTLDYFYLVPDIVQDLHSDEHSSWILIESEKLDYLKLRLLINVVTRFFSVVKGAIHNQLLRISNTKSAIGSIMSRNGSHNIGSHVLAALSHNVGTMPDDRVLYQYIQHRMDYIATATTEFPVWKQPLMLVGNILKTFLMQRHLLDHITGSEGLHAYQFQNPTIDTTTVNNQPNAIRLHVRRIDDQDEGWNENTNFRRLRSVRRDYLVYPSGESFDAPLKDDIEVAIPNGVIGQHAIYTIVENVLRNAAKHEWAKCNEEEKKTGSLDVYFDFKDNPDRGIVEVLIWTDSPYSKSHYRAVDFKDKVFALPEAKINELLDNEKRTGQLLLNGLENHQKLQVKVVRPFIGNDGQLRKENWGLAEMRISAGYLNVADIADIGGLSDSGVRFNLIKPVMVMCHEGSEERGNLNIDDETQSHYCLGYHFDIPKPRELLIAVPRDVCGDDVLLSNAHKKLMRFGIGILPEEKVDNESKCHEKSDRLSYSYILLREFLSPENEAQERDGTASFQESSESEKPEKDMRKWQIPFRVITESERPLSPRKNSNIDRRAKYVYKSKNIFDCLESELKAILTSDEYCREFANYVLADVYCSWIRHLKAECFEDENAELCLALDVNRDGSGGKDLISKKDLLKVVFDICFNKAVDSFKKLPSYKLNAEKKSKGAREVSSENEPSYDEWDSRLIVVLDEMKKLCPRTVDIETERAIDKEKKVIVRFNIQQLIRQQLIKWCSAMYATKLPGGNVAIACKAVWNCLWMQNQDRDPGPATINGVAEFVSYLADIILPQVKVFLSRYEEKFPTLPKSLTNTDDLDQTIGEIVDLDNQRITLTLTDDQKEEVSAKYSNRLVAYWRHEDFRKERAGLYIEPLSGAQSYLSSFECLKEGGLQATRFVAKLIENALLKILIIDERLKKFESEHSDVKKTFEHIGISVLDDTCEETRYLFSGKSLKEKMVADMPIARYDVLIIHQGIIDKRLEENGSAEVVHEFIERLKDEVRYVIVTTGRGTPANIPSDARVLPFSVVESTLFKKYPEKMLLVDAIMNILPSLKEEEK